MFVYPGSCIGDTWWSSFWKQCYSTLWYTLNLIIFSFVFSKFGFNTYISLCFSNSVEGRQSSSWIFLDWICKTLCPTLPTYLPFSPLKIIFAIIVWNFAIGPHWAMDGLCCNWNRPKYCMVALSKVGISSIYSTGVAQILLFSMVFTFYYDLIFILKFLPFAGRGSCNL